MKKLLALLFILFLNSFYSNGQKLIDQFPVFNAGEKVTYNAAYNWGFIWINAGYVEFKVSESTYQNQEIYHFNCFGTSLPSYDWLFKVRDYFQSYARTSDLAPLYYDRNTYEDDYIVHNRFAFDYHDSLIYTQTQNSNKPYREDTLKLNQTLYDVVSGVYLIRNIDFNQYQLNDTIPISMIIDNQIFNLYVRYLGKETIKTHNKRTFRTIKFSALLIEGTIFSGGEDLFVWVSDDLNRIPILVEAKILVGSVKATLNSTENLKFQLTSEIK